MFPCAILFYCLLILSNISKLYQNFYREFYYYIILFSCLRTAQKTIKYETYQETTAFRKQLKYVN